MFRHINGHHSRRVLVVEENLLARQTVSAVTDQRVFDPLNHFVNVTFDGVVFVGEVFYRSILSPVLQGDEESIFDPQFRGRLAAELVELLVGSLQDFEHLEKGLSFDAEEPFELSIACAQGFVYMFGLNQHVVKEKRKKQS